MIPPVAKPESLATEQLLEVLVDTVEHGAYPKGYALRCLIVLARDADEELARRLKRRLRFYEGGGR